MDIYDIKLLQLLIYEKNISRVADIMGVSQPAITLRLGKMRDQFKDPLLVKRGNQMELTSKAKSLSGQLKRVLDEIDFIMPDNSFDPKKGGATFRIFVADFFNNMSLVHVLLHIHKVNPKHQIIVSSFPNWYNIGENYTSDFRHADLVIGSLSNLRGFSEEVVYQDKFAIAYKDYPIARGLTYEQYLAIPHVVINFDDEYNDFLKYYLSCPDPRNIYARASTISAAIKLMEDQCVLTCCEVLALFSGLNYCDMPFATQVIPLKLYCPQRYQYDAKNKWLRKVIREITQKEVKKLRGY